MAYAVMAHIGSAGGAVLTVEGSHFGSHDKSFAIFDRDVPVAKVGRSSDHPGCYAITVEAGTGRP